jgi:uncharacterized DUF497 family protein
LSGITLSLVDSYQWSGASMGFAFEWDGKKAAANASKHGVSFEEAATAFGDPLSVTVVDPGHSNDESRFVLIGRTVRDRTVVVVHTERGDNIRIISARLATRRESSDYEQGET